MATPVAGKVSKLEIADWDTDMSEWNAYVNVGGRVDWNFNIDKTEIDAGHMDQEDGWSDFLQGRKNATLGGTLRYIEGDDGQEIIIDDAFDDDGHGIKVKFSLAGGGTPQEWESEGFVTNINPSPPDEDVTNMSFNIRLNEISEV